MENLLALLFRKERNRMLNLILEETKEKMEKSIEDAQKMLLVHMHMVQTQIASESALKATLKKKQCKRHK